MPDLVQSQRGRKNGGRDQGCAAALTAEVDISELERETTSIAPCWAICRSSCSRRRRPWPVKETAEPAEPGIRPSPPAKPWHGSTRGPTGAGEPPPVGSSARRARRGVGVEGATGDAEEGISPFGALAVCTLDAAGPPAWATGLAGPSGS